MNIRITVCICGTLSILLSDWLVHWIWDIELRYQVLPQINTPVLSYSVLKSHCDVRIFRLSVTSGYLGIFFANESAHFHIQMPCCGTYNIVNFPRGNINATIKILPPGALNVDLLNRKIFISLANMNGTRILISHLWPSKKTLLCANTRYLTSLHLKPSTLFWSLRLKDLGTNILRLLQNSKSHRSENRDAGGSSQK